MPRALGTFLAASVALFSASPALADPAAAGGEAEAPRTLPSSENAPTPDGKVWDETLAPKMRWYGEQTLLADAASVALVIAGVVASRPDSSNGSREAGNVLVDIGGGGYFLAAPIVHAAHGHWDSGAVSLGLRFGLPLGGMVVGGLFGLAVCGDSSGERIPCPVVATGLGAVAGAIAVPFVDAFALAYEPEPRASDKPTLAPTFSLVRGGGNVGLAGRF
jgi:hypothetical protein